jgi:metal-sulfur cluster biosynthetic enzyme
MTHNDILLKHLSTIVDPELGVNIVELGMVKDITYKDSTVYIQLGVNNC